ncbi:MAG: dockerin type I domain-containing protein [Pirellulaceae bacterium]|nr:dockerin type I domain-containing protein [Pirellulaceae bacterium]
MASLPFGALPNDTAEFMLGRIAVTPILMESTGVESVYDWTPQQKATVLANIQEGLDWWKQLLATKSSVHTLDWVIDTTYLDIPVATAYEPIKRISNDYARWVPDFLNFAGYNQTSNLDTNIRQFNDAQRTKLNTDWSFSIFVVNSNPNDLFAPGGSFSRAFAFAGGLYVVTPSNRPASTYAHEVGHMFWGRDEYPGGSNYFQKRGYYDSQNFNAVDLNPTPGFQPQLSIMSAGVSLDTAYSTLVTAQASLAQIGWQDSDGNGIFDILDVPLELNGTGRLDALNNQYIFQGNAKAKAFPNRNSSGLQNDITLNKIGRIEYRINNAATWTTLSSPNEHQATLDLRIPVPSGTTGVIEIRAIDPRIGVNSRIFQGNLSGFDATSSSGLNGFVWSDASNDGQRQLNEFGLAGWNVQLVDALGSLLDLQSKVEPDLFPIGNIASNAYSGVTLRAVGLDADGTLAVATDSRATTGTKVFVPYSPITQNQLDGWRDDEQNLEARFENLQASVSVDVFGLQANSYARLEAYSSTGQLLERITSAALASGQQTILRLNRDSADISYVVVKAHLSTRIGIDNLRFGASSQTVTGSNGEYSLPNLPVGTYNVKVTPLSGYAGTAPISSTQIATVTQGQATTHVDFGFFRTPSSWQNQALNTDVNNDGVVSPIDVLQVINAMTRHGSIPLEGSSVPHSPFIDVDGDRNIAPIDVLIVINYLARQSRGGSGEGAPSFLFYTGQPDEVADGEPADSDVAHLYTGDEDTGNSSNGQTAEPAASAVPLTYSSALPSPAPTTIASLSRRRLLSSSSNALLPTSVDSLMAELA